MNAPPPDEDPLWVRIKLQTTPLPRKQTKPIEPVTKTPTAKSKPREIRDHGFVKRTVQEKPNPKPLREDGHRRVRRGKVELTGQIDLHGMTEADARVALQVFLAKKQLELGKVVLVITGKGKKGEGVLRTALPNWLQQQSFSQLVSGYAPAHQRHGGNGAWYVFLRRRG